MPELNLDDISFLAINDEIINNYNKKIGLEIASQFKKREIINQDEFGIALKSIIQSYCDQFERAISKVNNVTFYLFVNNFHSNSIRLWERKLKRKFKGDYNSVSKIRRVLKLIIEQSVVIPLKGAPNFDIEIEEKRQEYILILDELIALAHQCVYFCDILAFSKLFPGITILKIRSLEIEHLYPFNIIMEHVVEDISTHDKEVIVPNYIAEFKTVLKEKVFLEYDILLGVFSMSIESNRKYVLMKYSELLDEICKVYAFDRVLVNQFYEGLLYTSDTHLCLIDSIVKNQNLNRFLFKPLVSIYVDEESYILFDEYKFRESIVHFSTHSLSFGDIPLAWSSIPALKDYFIKKRQNHDKILEDPVVCEIEKRNYKYSRNVKKFILGYNNIVDINMPNCGEIDLIFISDLSRVIYLCECKHNKPRHDFIGWARDSEKFELEYYGKFRKKINWVNENKIVVLKHFEYLYKCEFTNLEQFIVHPLFIINAPNICMYDSDIDMFTFGEFKLFVEGSYRAQNICIQTDSLMPLEIERPFFKNGLKHLIRQ